MRSLRPSVRFDVFRRDEFVCVYCGRRPPGVVLEVDHVVPVAKGGTDDPENLVTSCWDCNRGKGAKELGDPVKPRASHEQLEQMEERRLQAQAYAEAAQAEREFIEQQIDLLNEHWAKAFNADETTDEDGVFRWRFPKYGAVFPNERSLRTFLKKLPLHEILDAIDIAAGRGVPDSRADRYFYGICWRKIRGEDEPS